MMFFKCVGNGKVFIVIKVGDLELPRARIAKSAKVLPSYDGQFILALQLFHQLLIFVF